MRSLRENLYGVVDLSVILMIGIAFAALMVIAYIIWTLRTQLIGTRVGSDTDGVNELWQNMNTSIGNVTGGFDDAINLLLVAITIFILAIAISALLMLRGR